MNVAIVSREYPPFHGGGIGTYTQLFPRALARLGHRGVVITASADGSITDREEDGVRVVRLPYIRGEDWSGPDPAIASDAMRRLFHYVHPGAVFSAIVARHMREIVRRHDIHAIEVPDTNAYGWHLLDLVASGRRGEIGDVPVVVHVHSPSAWISHWNRTPNRWPQEDARDAMEFEQLRRADAIVCPSRAMKEWCLGRFGRSLERAHVVPYALLPTDDRATGASPRLRISTPPLHVLFVGRLEPRKGIDTLVKAASVAWAGGADFYLELVGEDAVHPESDPAPFGDSVIQAHVAQNHRHRIIARGKLTPDQVRERRSSANAWVAAVPSPMDNFPFTCVEAMLAGQHVIASRVGGMAEMIDDSDAGTLVDPGNVEAWAAALTSATSGKRHRPEALRRIQTLCDPSVVVPRRIDHFNAARTALGLQGAR